MLLSVLSSQHPNYILTRKQSNVIFCVPVLRNVVHISTRFDVNVITLIPITMQSLQKVTQYH